MENLLKQILDELQGLKSQMNQIESEMNCQFDEVKNEIRVVRDQTARVSEHQSSIVEFGKRLNDHEADLKLIKRVLSNH